MKIKQVLQLVIMFALISTLFGMPQNAKAAAPQGVLELVDNTQITGWALDSDYSGAIPIHIYVDGRIFDAVYANQYHGSQGYHGFSYTHPPFGPGNHQVTVFALGVDASGRINGENINLTNSPRTVSGSCNGYTGPTLAWCNGVSSYWKYRQTDSRRLRNDYILLAVDNSYGGFITQLTSMDKSFNLLTEHGGGGMQLSLYGLNTTVSPYKDYPPTNQRCVSGWPDPRILNPIQAQGIACRWEAVSGGYGVNEPSNDVDYSYTPSGDDTKTWYIRLNDPNNFSRGDVNFPGLIYEQTVELGDVYAKVTYKISNGSIEGDSASNQEIPAVHAASGINKYLYYANTAGQIQIQALSTVERVIPLSDTEGWWSICDEGTRCITLATKSPDVQNLVASVTNEGIGYTRADAHFRITSGLQKNIVIYVFPYRYDQDPNHTGVNIKGRINVLLQ